MAQTVNVGEVEKPVRVATRTVVTPFVEIPGIGAASAYADEDAFGTKGRFESVIGPDGELAPLPKSGVIQALLVIDEDDEALFTDLWLSRADFTSGTDNAAFAPKPGDYRGGFLGVLSNNNLLGVSGVTFGNNGNLAFPYIAPESKLYFQGIARGALNIAAGKKYLVALKILADV